MRQQQIDYILSTMLESYEKVSDFNITVDKPLQVETSGQLQSVSISPPIDVLTPFQAEIMALNLINGDRRLTRTLLNEGSCDLSYQLAGRARFRVNIFSRSGKYSIVLRKLLPLWWNKPIYKSSSRCRNIYCSILKFNLNPHI